jgi:polar amino acid transport system ATP-binding protein
MGFAREVADRVVFMDGGLIVEEGDPETVLGQPSHPRTREFLARVLDPVHQPVYTVEDARPAPAVPAVDVPAVNPLDHH